MMDIALVAAIAENNAFGLDGGLPWRLKGELALFKRITMGHAIIMGRKTYDSLPTRPLAGRRNIIISRTATKYDDAETCRSLDAALLAAEKWDKQQPEPKNIAMIIGGAEILRLALPQASVFYRTLVHSRPDADTFFDDFDINEWQEVETLVATPEYSTQKWIRK